VKKMIVVLGLVAMAACTKKNPQTGAQASALSASPPSASYVPRVGVAVSTGSRTCLALQNANVATGSAVTLVTPTLPQSFIQGQVGAVSQSPCPVSQTLNPALTSYDIQVSGVPKLTPLIAVLGTPAAFSQQNNNVQADLDQNGKTEFFRACSANDGVHLTVWSGTPTTGAVIWRGVYYEPEGGSAAMGPPCTEKEIAGLPAAGVTRAASMPGPAQPACGCSATRPISLQQSGPSFAL
jgi:hypothetical protein